MAIHKHLHMGHGSCYNKPQHQNWLKTISSKFKNKEKKPEPKITLRKVMAKFNLIDKTSRLLEIEEKAISGYHYGVIKITPEEFISKSARNGFWYGKEFIPPTSILSVEIVEESTFETDQPKG